MPAAELGPSQRPGASREETRWWPLSATATAGVTLGAGRNSQHPAKHQSQQGLGAAAKAANACPGASTGAGTRAECHRKLARSPRGPPYLDTFSASVQGVRPAARALPAPRAAGRGHAARAAQAAAVATCARKRRCRQDTEPLGTAGGTPRCGHALPEPLPRPSAHPQRGQGGSQRHMPTVPAKGFRSTQISSVGAGAADPPCDGERWDGLMSAPRDPWW